MTVRHYVNPLIFLVVTLSNEIDLDTMCTLPEYRRRGAASLMLKWAASFADKHGLVCYAETPISCVSLHFKNGFEEMDTIDLSIGDAKAYTLVCVLREPA